MLDLTAIKARLEAAKDMVRRLCLPRTDPEQREWIMSIPAEPARDPDLIIAASQADIPALVKEVEDLRAVLERLGWIGKTRWCPSCGKFEHEGHAKHCELARLLGR